VNHNRLITETEFATTTALLLVVLAGCVSLIGCSARNVPYRQPAVPASKFICVPDSSTGSMRTLCCQEQHCWYKD
jgi:hypothetical protein